MQRRWTAVVDDEPVAALQEGGEPFAGLEPGVDRETVEPVERAVEGDQFASLSHLDLALSFVHARSPALADLTGRYLADGNRRTQANFAVPEVVAAGNSLTSGFERWVREHIGEGFRISRAAAELGVTERSLQRATQAELGRSPRDFVDDIRLERAAHLLRTTPLTVDTVAAKVGYLNGGTLRNLVRRRRGMSMAEFRSAGPMW
ncbi:helix-turn-helix transcriptional regulator [Nocardia sp. NPDC050193]